MCIYPVEIEAEEEERKEERKKKVICRPESHLDTQRKDEIALTVFYIYLLFVRVICGIINYVFHLRLYSPTDNPINWRGEQISVYIRPNNPVPAAI